MTRTAGSTICPSCRRCSSTAAAATVFKRAHKTCDTANLTGGRRMIDAVHLDEIRCDGKAHGGCDAACLIFWKEAWLKKVDSAATTSNGHASASHASAAQGCTEAQVVKATRAASSDEADPTYSCQATMLPAATTLLHWWDVRQYVEDYTSGNAKNLGARQRRRLHGLLQAGPAHHQSPLPGAGALVRF